MAATAQLVPAHGADGGKLGKDVGTVPNGTSSSPTADTPSSATEAPPARIIHAHLSRPKVKRGPLQVLAGIFGVQLQGSVATNQISTSKYTLLTFLPVNLFEQFMRVANLYFLLCAILQLIPGLSPTSWFTTVAPLVFVLAVNAVKEGYDDVNRHKNDDQINNKKVFVLTEDVGEVPLAWKDVVAGDIVKVLHHEEIPADLLLLSSPDADNLCYVETANLDGETNLKIKYCYSPGRIVPEHSHKVDDYRMLVQDCFVGCEAPNPKLYVFDGFLQFPDGHKEPLDVNNLLLRGSTLRKTDWVIGVAVSVGTNTKIVQNMTRAPRKVTQLERWMNVLVFIQFSVLLGSACLLSGLSQWWQTNHPAQDEDNNNSWVSWYLLSTNAYPEPPPGGFGWFVGMLRFIILLSNLIPISLYVTLEVVKVLQCAMTLNQDRAMYNAEFDTPFQCRTTTLNEELGQVQYVLSDKTGTLTQNVMGFVWASIDGVLYGRNVARDGLRSSDTPTNTPHSIALDQDIIRSLGLLSGRPPVPAVESFLLNLAVCNTVVPSVGEDGQIMYQASSPDEEALVQGAAYLGYKLVSRSTEQVQVEHHGKLWTYDVLAVLEFNSDRKRMSVIARTPDDRIMLFCKGADSIMYARLAHGQQRMHDTHEHLDEMARGGFRTLVIAERELSREVYTAWASDYEAASVAITDREGKLDEVSARIEQELQLVGATAVEDKLQDGVPECLQALAAAGIKVWVLTGDKVETAISIAYSCRLFSEDMAIIEFRERDFGGKEDEATKQTINAKHREVDSENQRMRMSGGATNVGLVIEGGALAVCLAEFNQDAFLAMCKACKAVVCCRVSPMQKAQVTNMVKRKAGAITLGIGDGANDVGMIRAAHIGVGISGREGRAAVLSSDFSFAQFRYLSRLLLLHGRWAYIRNREVVLYSFYKNWAYCLVYIYLQCYAGFSAQPIFTTLLISTFNLIFTALPVGCYGLLEQDLDASTILSHPVTYNTTRCQTRTQFYWQWALYMFGFGTWHSLPAFLVSWYTLTRAAHSGVAADLAGTGTAIFITMVIVVSLKLATRTRHWNWIYHLILWVSILLVWPFVYVLSVLFPSIYAVSDMTGVGAELFGSATYWLGAVLLAPGIALLPDLVYLAFQKLLRPTIVDLLQEWEVDQRIKNMASRMENGFSPASHIQAMANQQHAGTSHNRKSSKTSGNGPDGPGGAAAGAGGSMVELQQQARAASHSGGAQQMRRTSSSDSRGATALPSIAQD